MMKLNIRDDRMTYETHIDEDGEEYYTKEIIVKWKFSTYNDGWMDEIDADSLLEFLNDKSMDDIGWLEKIED